jgi:hypothetical protein
MGKQGNSFTNAVFAVLDQLADDVTIPTPAAGIDPDDNWVTVEGKITTLFDPASPTQYQVGYLEDDDGDSIKVTVWARSKYGPMVRTLREGDRGRISLGNPGEYNGTTTVAATSETCICLLECGDGPAPVRSAQARASRRSIVPAVAGAIPKMILQALRPIDHEHSEIETSGASLDELDVATTRDSHPQR